MPSETLRRRETSVRAPEAAAGEARDEVVEVLEFRGRKKLLWRADGSKAAAVEPLQHDSAQLRESLFSYLFLPQGYPLTVTDDYKHYQFYDTLQALFSGITGVLATRAVFRGVGVGDAMASPAAATVQWLCKDGTASFGRIGFASVIAKQLDSDSKRWRLVADIANDAGIFLEILSGFVPREYFLAVICLATMLKTVCNVSAGITRACLTFHFAKGMNTADIAAKDGNQETAVSLTGILLGFGMTYLPESAELTWGLFFFFTFLHLYANWKGVKGVVLRMVNRYRLELSLKGGFPSPERVAEEEAVLLYRTQPVVMGAKLSDVLRTSADLLKLVRAGRMFSCAVHDGWAYCALRKGATMHDELVGYCVAYYMLTERLSEDAAVLRVEQLDPLKQLERQGWEMDNIMLNADEFRYEF